MFCLDDLEQVGNILLSLMSMIGIGYGIIIAKDYKSKLKEKHNDSLFSFYARLIIYLLDFQNRLGKSPDNTILSCKYSDSCLANLEDFSKPKYDEIKSFTDFILDFIEFLKNTENQVSLNESFNDNFNQFKHILFDLTKLFGTTPYIEYNDNKPVIAEYNSINSLVNELLTSIKTEQKKILSYKKRIHNSVYQRILTMK